MFSVWSADISTCAGSCAGLTDAGLTDAGDVDGLLESAAEMHCNANANTIVSSTNVFLARFSIIFQLTAQNVLCSSKLTNVNLFTKQSVDIQRSLRIGNRLDGKTNDK